MTLSGGPRAGEYAGYAQADIAAVVAALIPRTDLTPPRPPRQNPRVRHPSGTTAVVRPAA